MQHILLVLEPRESPSPQPVALVTGAMNEACIAYKFC